MDHVTAHSPLRLSHLGEGMVDLGERGKERGVTMEFRRWTERNPTKYDRKINRGRSRSSSRFLASEYPVEFYKANS